MEAHLQVHSLSKSYPGRARALDSVSLNVYPGEVHAIIGENGAGKSTLAKVIAGLEPYREGEMYLAGEPYRPASPGAAIRSGVVMVHQHFQLFETLTAAQNVVLGSEPGTRLRFGARTANEEVAALAGRYGFQVNPESRVRGLSVAQRQGVEILRALYRQASLLLLDEPTSALGPTETKALLAAIRRLRHYGHTIVLIAHKISEVLAVADRITVLRQGKHVGTLLRRDASHELLFEMVTGERQVPSTGAMFSREVGGGNGPAALKLSDLYLPLDRAAALGPISLTVNSAEILGVFTPPHSGQQTLELALVGQIPVRAGQILIGSHDVTKLSPYERRRLGAAFVPSERMARGVATRATVYENAVALLYRKSDRNRLPSGPRGRHPLDEFTHSLLKKFNISAPGSQSRVANLSGGNTQRLLLGRELLSAELMQEGETPLVVVVASPTQGVDARGVGFIHDLLREYRDRGSGVLLLTGDVEELLALSDRITVLKGGGRLSRVISNFPKLAEGDIEALIDGPPPANHVESESHP